MSLDPARLENVHRRGDRIIARCPACAKDGHDQKGEHLVIMPNGRFGCVVHPGAEGKEHRKCISALAGDPGTLKRGAFHVRVRRPASAPSGRPTAEVVDVACLGPASGKLASGPHRGQPSGLHQPACGSDDVGRFGRVSSTHAPRVSETVPNDEEGGLHVHTRSAARNPSNASTPVQESHADGPQRLGDVLQPDLALAFVRRVIGDQLPALSERLGMVQAATDCMLLAWNHEDNELARKLGDVEHRGLALAAVHAGMVLVGALHAGQDAMDAGQTATEALCELLGIDIGSIFPTDAAQCGCGSAPDAPVGKNIDTETGYPIINGAICPF